MEIGDRLGTSQKLSVSDVLACSLVRPPSVNSSSQVVFSRQLLSTSVHLLPVVSFPVSVSVSDVATVPTWQSECSKPHRRGQLVMMRVPCVPSVLACAQWIGFGFFFFGNDPRQWRPVVALQCAPALIVFFMIMFLPESPRWLVKKGRNGRSTLHLSRLARQANWTTPTLSRTWNRSRPLRVSKRELPHSTTRTSRRWQGLRHSVVFSLDSSFNPPSKSPVQHGCHLRQHYHCQLLPL